MSHSPPPTLKSYCDLHEILQDRGLAALGDAYVNFVYSLALSQRQGCPAGAKVDNRVLARAVDLSGLRGYLPHRVDKHERGDAAEALLVFAWLSGIQDLDDCTKALGTEEDPSQAFSTLLKNALEKLDDAHGHAKQST
jgi:hypothetical protein